MMHEARCEFLRKTSASQPQIQQVPINNYPSHQEVIHNYNRTNPPPQNYPSSQPPYRQNSTGYGPTTRAYPPPNQVSLYQNNPPPNQRAMETRQNPSFNQNPNPANSNAGRNMSNLNNFQIFLGVCSFCRKQMPVQELEEHELYCPLTMERCPHCSYEYPRSFISAHCNSCPMLVSFCPECKEEYPLEILQEHINATHLPPPPQPQENDKNKKREPSPSFFDKMKNFFSSNDKKDKPKSVKCEKCKNKILLSEYEKHVRQCLRPPPPPQRNPGNHLFSLMMNQDNGRRVLVRQPSNGLRNNMNEMDLEARKMRELMLLMHLLLAQRPREDPGMKDQDINDNTILCKYDMDKNSSLNEDYKKCSICQCDFEQEEEVRIFVCLHRYHKDCADAWLKKKSWCPLCRKNVRSGQDEEFKEDDEGN